VPLPWNEVNVAESQTVAQLIGLPKANRSEARKWGCPYCGSSDALHAYPGVRAGFGCWAACGAGQPKGCRGYSNLDVAMQHWGAGAADACRRLAAILGIVYVDDPAEWWRRPRPMRPAPMPAPVAQLSAQERNLQALLAVPGALRPPAVYADVVARLDLTRRGTAYLARGRRLDARKAEAYGYRSIDGRSDWIRLADHLTRNYQAVELAAAGFPIGERGVTVPFNGRFPALVIPFWRAGELVGLRFRNLLPDRPEYKHNRYRTLKDAKPLWPYHADALHGQTVHVVEGELNAETLRQLGACAIGLYGAGIWLDHWTAGLAGALRIVAWFDCRDPRRAGDLGAAALHRRLIHAFGDAWTAQRWRRMITDHDPNALHQQGRLAPILSAEPWEGALAAEVPAA
jgi:hypothetical protein